MFSAMIKVEHSEALESKIARGQNLLGKAFCVAPIARPA